MSSPDSNASKKVEDHTAFKLGDYTWKEMHADMEADHFAGTYGGRTNRADRAEQTDTQS